MSPDRLDIRIVEIILFLLIAMLVFTVSAWAYKLDAKSNWSVDLSGGDLISGIATGSTGNFSRESDENEVELSLQAQSSSKDWKVYVKMDKGANWPQGVKLSVKRTGGGVGSGSISGEESYILVEKDDKEFFFGDESQARNKIPIQFKLEGSFTDLQATSFKAEIIYTVEPQS